MYMQGILGTQKGNEIISTIENSKDKNVLDVYFGMSHFTSYRRDDSETRKTDGKTLMKEKRNAAGDPADYFEYIQFSFGNCIAGDRLVMERMLGKNPSEEHLKDSFYPGISYYFDYQKLLSHPDYCNDGYHPCKIKDSLSLNDYLHAIIIPKKEEKSLRPIISTDLMNQVIFMDNTGHDLWSWTSKCYKKIKKLNSLRY